MLSIAKTRKKFHELAPVAAVALVLSGCACADAARTGSGVALPFTFRPDPGALPAGVQVSPPGHDGGSFSAVLPVRPEDGLDAGQVLEQVLPVLRAIGFDRRREDLGVPGAPLRLEPVDLAVLAEEVCREPLHREDETSREVCAALTAGPVSPAAEAAFGAAYGTGFAAYREELERETFQYTFPQLVGGVPIEGSGVLAFRRAGESVSIVHGSLFNLFAAVNRVDEGGRRPLLDRARRLLRGQQAGPLPELFGDEPVLVLLPVGRVQAAGREVVALRYAWRTLMAVPGRRESWMAWVDAADGGLLKVAPQWSHAAAQGERWRRDPGLCQTAPLSCTETRPFEVDAAAGGKLTLQLNKVFKRIDLHADDEYGNEEVAVPDDGKTFLRDWIGKEQNAVCAAGNNSAFRQVHAYSHLYALRQMAVGAGIVPSFPEKPIQTYVDVEDDGKGSAAFYDDDGTGKNQSILWFVDGAGFQHAGCPGTPDLRLNGVHDVTTLAHEMSHLSVWRLQERRPPDWCKSGGSCPVVSVEAHNLLHSFTDGLAFAYASTNCFSGWTDKNRGGLDKARYCRNPAATSEKGGFPRLAWVGDSLNPAAPGDHFPEHRALDAGNYADGQIAAAALWKVRQGLRSKLSATGTLELWARFHRALWGFGFFLPACTSCKTYEGGKCVEWRTCDVGLYQVLRDLETRMVELWSVPPSGGADLRHTGNKVLGGWARAGIFLVPPECVDGNVFTKNATFCPLGEGGGDAVIDVDDRTPADDPVADGVTHPEVDWLKRSGPPPLFRVWTGPRFRFGAGGKASTAGPFPCHAKLKVEAASDAGFTANRWESGEISAFPSGGPGCYAEVVLPDAAWIRLKGASGTARIYYRARTWSASGADERRSTRPGAGTYTLPPPFAVVNDSGKP